MTKRKIRFSRSTTEFYFNGAVSLLKTICEKKNSVIITDENVFHFHKNKFKGWNTIVLKAGEEYKVQDSVDAVVEQLIALEMDRKSTIIGMGGGVITDLSGYIASVYLRGIRFGFVPTTILGMVDASVGGKNGIDVGEYKNLVGTIRQPEFILHDPAFLQSLPQSQWSNGFAEVIKHACIKDARLFKQLETSGLFYFQKNKNAITDLVQKNVLLKSGIVQKDEYENGERRLLNFGHTIGHALETQYELMHGEAISLGMVMACRISEQFTGFTETERVMSVLQGYNLPVSASFDPEKVFQVLRMDKKRERKEINYVLIEKIGRAVIKPVSLKQLEKLIQKLSS